MAVSKIRQNYHEDCEALINKQINMEFYASYVYLSMVSTSILHLNHYECISWQLNDLLLIMKMSCKGTYTVI